MNARVRRDVWGRAAGWCAALAAVVTLGGCATPRAELGVYRGAFDQARAAGEQVLLDYSVDKDRHARLAAERAAERAAASPDAERLRAWRDSFGFDPEQVAAGPGEPDDVMVRLAAWEVVQRYNEALAALAEGRSQEELGEAVGGFIGALRSFPVQAIAKAGASAAPFGEALTAALALAQKAYEAHKFRKAVLAGTALTPTFVAMLKEDTVNFYRIRMGLHDLDRGKRLDAMAERFGMVNGYAMAFDPATNPDARADLARIRADLRRTPAEGMWTLSDSPANGRVLTETESTNLARAAAEIHGFADAAAAHDAALLAYRDVLVEYVRLLDGLDAASGALRQAAEHPRLDVPPLDDLLGHALLVKRAIATYEAARRRED